MAAGPETPKTAVVAARCPRAPGPCRPPAGATGGAGQRQACVVTSRVSVRTPTSRAISPGRWRRLPEDDRNRRRQSTGRRLARTSTGSVSPVIDPLTLRRGGGALVLVAYR